MRSHGERRHISTFLNDLVAFFFQVKSLQAVSVQSVMLDDCGFVNDRRYMLVTPSPTPLYGSFLPTDATHRFLTQRQCPSLATVRATLVADEANSGGSDNVTETTLTLSCPLLPPGRQQITLSIDETNQTGTPCRASLWGDIVTVHDMGDIVANYLKDIVDLDKEVTEEVKQAGVRLVRQGASHDRLLEDAYVPPAARQNFWKSSPPPASLTDGFPILIACQASLDYLNQKIKAKQHHDPIPMSRFRPNIVIHGTRPFEEDRWKVIRIYSDNDSGSGIILHVVKACPRCKQSCTDQSTGVVTAEPLATMADFRKLGNDANPDSLFFAQNAVMGHGMFGKIVKVGAKVQVLEWGDPVYEG